MSNVMSKLIEAYSKVNEKKKLDPVDAKALKGKHDDREDGDIDNDGDEDESDEYLHNRRKAVKKAMDEGKEECPKCEGEGCDHCDDKGYHMTNEAVELDEMTSAQKAKFDKLYKKMLNGPEHKKIMSKADNKIKGDDQFHALVKKMAMEEVSEAITISRKMAHRALANVKAQPKDKVSLKKAPWDKDKKSTNEEDVVMNPKQKKDEKGSDTMSNESVMPSVYARILENRAKQTKGATAPEGMMDNSKSSKGAMDMVNQPVNVNDDDEKGHDDASKAGRASPNAKARSGDNMKGDKKVIPSATKMKG